MPPWVLAAGLFGVVILGVGIFLAWRFFLGGEASNPTAKIVGEGSRLEASSTPGYALASDASGKLSAEVPYAWNTIDGTSWDFQGGKIGLSLIAMADLDTWYHQNYYHDSPGGDMVPGMLFGVSKSLVDKYPEDTEDQILGLKLADYSDTCKYDSRNDYDDGTYKGKYDVWTNCGDNRKGQVFLLAALPADRSYVAVVRVVAANEADLEAQKHVLDTFKVTGFNGTE